MQYQILVDLFKQSQNNVETNNAGQAQVNQIGSFSTDFSHKVADASSIGKLLSYHNLQYLKSCWILDSEATDHFCISLTNFVSYKCIKPVLINLPNGNKVFAHYSRTIVSNYKFYLTNVLYVPQFSFNLISVSKNSSNLNCRLIFSSNKCVIQDIVTSKRIGIANTIAGLYVFDSATFYDTAAKTIVSSINCPDKIINLWHYKMGHLSYERLGVLRSQYPYVSFHKIIVCNTCHRSKQKKLHFALSDTRATQNLTLFLLCMVINTF